MRKSTEIRIPAGTRVQRWIGNGGKRQWVETIADVSTKGRYFFGSYIYKIAGQVYSVPAIYVS